MKLHPWILGLVSLALCAQPLVALENETFRRDQLRRLRGAIRAYAQLNGKAVTKLSQLLDENLVEGPGAFMRSSASTVPARGEIDARTDYTLEPLAGAAELVVRERFPLAGESEVLAIFVDGTVRALAATAGPSPTIATNRATTTPSESRTTTPSAGGNAFPVDDRAPPQTTPSVTRAMPRTPPAPASESSSATPTSRAPMFPPSSAVVAPTTREAPTISQAPVFRATNPGSSTPAFTMRGSGPGGVPTEEEAAAMAGFAKMIMQRAAEEAARATTTPTPDELPTDGRVITFPGAGGEQFRIDRLPPGTTATAPFVSGTIDEFHRPAGSARKSPADFERILKLAQAADAKGDVGEALEHYEMAVNLKPDSIEALAGLARALNREGDLSEAVMRYLEIQASVPTTPNLALRLAELYVGLEDLPRARREVQRELKAQPDSALVLSWLATIEMLEGNRPSAREHFQQAVKRDPRVSEERYQNIVWMLTSGQANRATTEAASVLMMNPRHGGAMFAAGEAYAQLENRARAVSYFQRYLEVDGQGEWAARAQQRIKELGAPTAAPR